MNTKANTMVSIIIVNYHVKKELFACIRSIYNSKPKYRYEIIVVDNDEIKTISSDLHRKFPKVIYVPNKNKGFGQGNNVGFTHAKGEYLFFLNPDTKVFSHCIDHLVEYLKKNKKTGIVAPVLYDNKHKLYPQGANELTPYTAIFSFSIIHKVFPNNPIARKYWMADEWDRKSPKSVASIPGTAFLIRSAIYKSINGFDETFFMYFEEHDLCRRVRKLDWGIAITPEAKVYHALGRSSKQLSGINQIFLQSRFYYFKKYYGFNMALLTEGIMRTSKYTFALIGLLFFAYFISTYKIDEYLTFIGDQSWYYFSAREMLVTGDVPLVGIPSSHPWLHQGAFWTYMLAPILGIFGLSPLTGAYLSIFLHLITSITLYFIISKIFSERTAIIATLLYITSPLIVMHVRMPYHTSPIPLLSILYYYAMYKWVEGKTIYFPICIFLLATLYNFEIATFLLTIVFITVFLFGFVKRTHWFVNLLHKRIAVISLISFLVPMLPMLVYDLSHGFPQTLKFLAWVVYRILIVFGYPPINSKISESGYNTVLLFLGDSYKKITYLPDALVALLIGIFAFSILFYLTFNRWKEKTEVTKYILLNLIVIISICGIIATKTASDAYIVTLFPFIILINAIFYAKLLRLVSKFSYLIIFVIVTISLVNIYELPNQKYLVTPGVRFADKVVVVKELISQVNGREYNLLGTGIGSSHESFIMSYSYIALWQGKPPTKTKQDLRFIIEETPSGIKLTKQELYD